MGLRSGLPGQRELAQVFAEELALHAPGVDREEDRSEEDEAEESSACACEMVPVCADD